MLENGSLQPDVTLWSNEANFGRGRFIFEVNFEQPEHRKHPYFYTLKCSRVNVVSLIKADLRIKN